MKLDTTFLRSKVARRIFLLFILCALVPISALAILSFSQVTRQLEEQSQRRLHQATKALALSVFERLLLLENELGFLCFSLNEGPEALIERYTDEYQRGLKERFKGLALVNDSGRIIPLLGEIQRPVKPSAEARQHLKSGKAVLLTRLDENNDLAIYMLRAIEPQDPTEGILLGAINATYVWGMDGSERVPSVNELFVLDESNKVIYTTLPHSSSFLQKLALERNGFSFGRFELKYGGKDYLGASWSLPLKFHFFTPDWTITLSIQKDNVFASISYFKKLFPLAVLLSLWVVLLLSVIQIRKIMLPLEKLKEGTERMAAGEFDTVVSVASGDEFEGLAASFNNMTRQLDRQFNALATMAEIHRAILSTLEIEEIVTTVLTRAHTIFHCDCVSFGVFESGSSGGLRVYTYVGNGSTKNGKVAEQIELSQVEMQRLLDNPDILSINADEPLPQYLAPIARGGAKSFLVLPLLFEHGLLGVIAFGYLHPHSLTREDLAQARQLADQVAVAMANAQLIEVRKRAENALHRLNLDLEKRVKERTKELALINKHLQREVAVRKQTELDLRQAKEEADIASRAKSEFLANMSHELRTPLNAIIGFNEMLVDKLFGDLNQEQEEYLKDMLESAHHLLSLINDILDLSKVEAGKLELTRSQFSLKDLLSRSLVIIKEKAANHGITLSIEAQGLPEVVNADERKIKQIIYNLLSNALKFTPDGGSVNISALSLSGANGRLTLPDGTKVNLPDANQLKPRTNENYVMISVADSGIGIKPEDQAKVFEPFEQVDSSTGRRYQGTGLGLALTKKLVELHDGRLWVESEGEGKGSTFNFTIQV